MPDIFPFNDDTSRIIPAWLHGHLRYNKDVDLSWSDNLLNTRTGPYSLSILEPLDTNAPDCCQPYCCYSSTVIFYHSFSRLIEHGRLDYPHRTFPCTQFVCHGDRDFRVFEVFHARIVHVFDRWHVEWKCMANTELALHFGGRCEPSCRVCKILYGNHAPYAGRYSRFLAWSRMRRMAAVAGASSGDTPARKEGGTGSVTEGLGACAGRRCFARW